MNPWIRLTIDRVGEMFKGMITMSGLGLTVTPGAIASSGTTARLAEAGKATCSIVLPIDALELEKLAARELADHLEKVIGDRPMLAGTPRSGTSIYVGRSPTIERLVAGVNFNALGTDGIVIRTVGDDLVLTGGRPRGVLFAVYTFLQDVIGVRWWDSDATDIPGKPTLTVSDLNVVYRPPFDLRHFRTAPLNDRAFALRLRHNGGLMNYHTGEHTIGKLLPPEEHFVEHPDWYMYTPEGEDGSGRYSYRDGLKAVKENRPDAWYRIAEARRRLSWQVCTSSPGALEATTQAVLQKIEKEYSTWQYPPKVIWVSQSDGRLECKCDKCLKIKQREHSASGVWIEFVNAIAKRIEPKYPDVLVATMAFLHTEQPPTHLRPHDNVLVYSIPVEHNRKLLLTGIPQGQWVAKWCGIAKHVYIWEHETNFRNWLQPHPNHFVLPKNLSFFADHGVTGMMIQGGYGNASEFQRMRAYVVCQLMWDPHQDVRSLHNEFLRGYYGDAGPFLMKWIDVQHRAVNRDEDISISAYATSTENWLTLEDLNIGTRLFQQARQAVAGDKLLEYRVRRANLSIDIVWLHRYDELRATAAEGKQPFFGPSDPHAALDELAKDEFNVESYKMGGEFPEFVGKLREALATHTHPR